MASSSHPFDSTDILNIPEFSYDDDTTWQGFRFEKGLQSTVFNLPDAEQKPLHDLQLGTFKLEIEDVPIPSIEASSASSYTTAEDDTTRHELQVDEDTEEELWKSIWTFPEVKDVSRNSKLTSWDHFSNGQHVEPVTAYLSETGARTFDAVVAVSDPKQATPLVIADSFFHSLYELGRGRSSILFEWQKEEQIFAQTMNSFTISGFTPALIQQLVKSTGSAGTLMKKLSEPEMRYCRDTDSSSPSGLAFYSALRSCMTAVQKHMEDQRPEITTILELQHKHSVVICLLEMLGKVADLVQSSTSDVALLGELLKRATDIALQYPRFEEALNQIVSSIAMPVLQELNLDVGLGPYHGAVREEFLAPEGDHWRRLLPLETLQLVQEAEQALRLLKEDSPDRLSALLPSGTDPEFRLEFSWQSLCRLQTDAQEYERRKRSVFMSRIPNINRGSTASQQGAKLGLLVQTLDTVDPFQLLDFNTAFAEFRELDSTYTSALTCLRQEGESTAILAASYDEALVLSISPMLSAQHRLFSYSIFQRLFEDHALISHLTLQHQIQLLGDGTFSARLATALFDPEQSSGEGRRRASATTGLRLQARDTWPPASSELRLVLMGILSESMSTSASLNGLENTISFAIRDLSDDDLEKCRAVDSVQALDFLKVSYRPPNPVVEAVISPESLEKYDRIFNFLLRVLRLKSVAQGLLRDVCHRRAPVSVSVRTSASEHRFRIEIQTFVSAVAGYVQNVAVARNWSVFEKTIRGIDAKVKADDYEGALSIGGSMEKVRSLHEGMLDAMTRALLLKRKQSLACRVLEEIFGVVLGYAARVGRVRERQREEDAVMDTPRRYHEEFRTLVKKFVGLLKEIVKGRETRAAAELGLELVEEFLLSVDFGGYWSR